jgi:phage gp46-like protein
MSDIALVVVQDQATGRYLLDWALDGPDLQAEDGLFTDIAVSLFTDRTANPDDDLPADDSDIRGWWGDTPPDGGKPDPIGSRLWLLARAKHDDNTARRAVLYAREALAWLVADGIAQSFDVTASWANFETLALGVKVNKRGTVTQNAASVFEFKWTVTFSDTGDFTAIAVPTALTTEGGSGLVTEDGQSISLE